ncbi:MAG: HD domain-containing protein [Candidatus Woesearchaeota archaeon]
MNLPSEQQCLDWFKEFKVPRNILQHCLKVRETALILAERFQQRNHPIDIELIDRMALLHDLFKMATINLDAPPKYHRSELSEEELLARENLIKNYPGMHEGEIAYSFLLPKYPELALALKRSASLTEKKECWEEIIVHYADWRTLQNKIVTIPERIIYLEQVYKPRGVSWEEHKAHILKYEDQISEVLGLSPEQMFVEVKV